jgi:hypothetical protein
MDSALGMGVPLADSRKRISKRRRVTADTDNLEMPSRQGLCGRCRRCWGTYPKAIS